MATFWIIATLLILLAFAFVIPPLLRKAFTISEVDQAKMNLAIYKERLAELTQENLSPEQFAQAKQELDKILAQDLPDQPELAQKPHATWISLVFTALFIPTFTILLYGHFGRPDYLEPQLSEATPTLPANFDEMVTKLATRLEKEPDDAKGWEMLAHSYVALERYSDAAKAYEQLLALGNQQNPQILVDYAEVLALVDKGQIGKKSLELLQAAIAIAPDDPEALWLLGLAAVQMSDYATALTHWEHLQTLLPAEAETAKQQLAEQLTKIRQLAQTSTAFATTQTTSSTQLSVPVADRSLVVTVSIDPSLSAQVQPHYIVFIYARAQTGVAMPLAIVKKTAAELPLKVVFDNNTTLNPEIPLSQFQQPLNVVARISKSGNATAQSGDLQGEVSGILLDQQQTITIVINHIIP